MCGNYQPNSVVILTSNIHHHIISPTTPTITLSLYPLHHYGTLGEDMAQFSVSEIAIHFASAKL